MYLFTKAVLSTDYTFKKSDGIHFIPFIFVLPLVQINYQRLPHYSKIEVIDQALNNPPSMVGIITIIIFGIIAVYLFFSFREIKVYNAKLNMEYADLHGKNVGWLSTILISFLLIFAFSFVQNILRYSSPGLWNAAIIISSIIFLYIGSRLLFKFMEYQIPYLSSKSTNKKVNKSDEDRERLKEVADLLDNAMKTKKHFLNPDITLHSLAKMLELKPALVSQSLNQVVKRNFFDYINKRRIEYACQLLKTYTSKEKNITEIMYESGFNSKSSFNTAFKKYLGVTPTSYRREL
jgi:AraC-like DNA-binding protein